MIFIVLIATYLVASLVVFFDTRSRFISIDNFKDDVDIDFDIRESLEYKFNIVNYIFPLSILLIGINHLIVIIYDWFYENLS